MITWATPTEFELSGQRYDIGTSGADASGSESTDDMLLLAKSPGTVEGFQGAYGDRDDVRHVVHLGILGGGAPAFCAQVCRPEVLVAIDHSAEPVVAFERFIARYGLEQVVRPRYGVDQSNVELLLDTVRREFRQAELDLVVDDASHRYRPTRASFEALFPLVRSGGRYLIQKWAWAHYATVAWQHDGGPLRGEPALTNLVVEIAMLAGSRPDLVLEVRLDSELVEVVRGPGALDAPMDLRRLCRNRSNRFRPLL